MGGEAATPDGAEREFQHHGEQLFQAFLLYFKRLSCLLWWEEVNFLIFRNKLRPAVTRWRLLYIKDRLWVRSRLQWWWTGRRTRSDMSLRGLWWSRMTMWSVVRAGSRLRRARRGGGRTEEEFKAKLNTFARMRWRDRGMVKERVQAGWRRVTGWFMTPARGKGKVMIHCGEEEE